MFKNNTKIVLLFFIFSIIVLALLIINSLYNTNKDSTAYISIELVVILIILYSSYKLGMILKKLSVNLEFVNNYNEELETILNNSSDGIVITNLRGGFLFVNNSFIELCHLSKNNITQYDFFNLLDIESTEKIEKALSLIQEKSKISGIAAKLILPNKKVVYVNISLSLMPDKLRVIISVADTTKTNSQHEKIVEIQSRLASIGEMTAAIGHQWKQPLNSINMLISALRFEKSLNTLNDEKEEDYFNQINTQVSHMAQTLEDFKGFIQEKKKMEYFLINDTIKNAINLTQPSLLKYSIVVINDSDEKISIMSNESAILQTLVNIINNAKDAIKDKIKNKNKLELNVIKITLSKDAENVMIKVIDSGGGIKEEYLDKIFEMLFTTKKELQGTGIGLHMSKKLINKINGRIGVKNTEFTYKDIELYGAEFTITLPNKYEDKSN